MRRFLPLLILLLAFAAFWVAGGLHRVSLSALGQDYGALRLWADAHPARALAAFVALYAALVATVIFPAAFVLTIAGGLLFGPWLGAAASMIAVNLGGTVAFLAARQALARGFVRVAGRSAALRDDLARDGALYLFALRTTPLLPYWAVTLAAAAAGLRTPQFVLGSLLGVIPPTLVWARLGAAAAARTAHGEPVSIAALAASPQVLWPLAALALLSFAVVGFRAARLRALHRKSDRHTGFVPGPTCLGPARRKKGRPGSRPG